MWWPGNISTAIEAIVADQKLLVVVALGKDPASQDVSKIFEESEIMRSKIQPGCIVLRIVDGSQEFSDFNDFWTVHGTPMIFFMNGKGEMVRDPLAGAVTEAQILRALVAIKTEQMPSVPRQENSQEESVQKNSEMPGTSETEEEKAEEIRLKTEQYRQKIEVARLRKEKEAQEKQRQDEIRRREDGKKGNHAAAVCDPVRAGRADLSHGQALCRECRPEAAARGIGDNEGCARGDDGCGRRCQRIRN